MSIQPTPARDFCQWKAITAIFLALTLTLTLVCTNTYFGKNFRNVKKIIIASESNPRPMQCSLNTLLLSHKGNQPGDNFRSFNLHGKGKIQKQ